MCGFKEQEFKLDDIRNVFEQSGIEKQFDVICPSIYGEIRYMLARSTKGEVLYIAFGGNVYIPFTIFSNKDDIYFQTLSLSF